MIRLGAVGVLIACVAGAAAFAQDRPVDVFLGAKLGMSKLDFATLPSMKRTPPRCLRFDLPPPSPARDVQSCELPADDMSLARRYLFAPDPAGVTRLIAISMIGERRAAPASLESLAHRLGKPKSTTAIEGTDGRIHVWTLGAQQLLLRYPCSGKEDLCIEYTDRPFARRAVRSATGLLGPPGDRS